MTVGWALWLRSENLCSAQAATYRQQWRRKQLRILGKQGNMGYCNGEKKLQGALKIRKDADSVRDPPMGMAQLKQQAKKLLQLLCSEEWKYLSWRSRRVKHHCIIKAGLNVGLNNGPVQQRDGIQTKFSQYLLTGRKKKN